MVTSTSATAWWGPAELEVGHQGRWRLGPLHLLVEHRRQEWRVAVHRAADPMDASLSAEISPSVVAAPPDAELTRYATSSHASALFLSPALADRTVVIRPEDALFVPAGDAVTLFVSTPVWLQLALGTPQNLVADFPVFRPKNTWSGSSTTVGTLAYAIPTRGRLRPDDLPARPHRAVSSVRILNHGATALLLERLNLPIRSLSLYCDEHDLLVTDHLVIDRQEDEGATTARVEERSESSQNRALLAGPRDPDRSLLSRALTFFQ